MTMRTWLLACSLSSVVAVPAAHLPPQRDLPVQPRTGTSRISGVVITTDETPQPVRRAIVSLTPLHAGGSPLGYHAITDDEGRFTFSSLLEGRYDISAARPSFVTIPFGSTKPRRTASPLVIEPGENAENVRLLLARGSVIAGTVRDDTGEPIAGLDVRVELRAGAGSTIATARTDDQGTYRIFGLAAGDYVVSTRPTSPSRAELTVPTDAQVDTALRELQARRGRGGPDPRRDLFVMTNQVTLLDTFNACNATNPFTATPLTSKWGYSWVMGENCCTLYNHVAPPNSTACAGIPFPGTMTNMAMQVPPSSNHPNGAQILMVDGSVKFCPNVINIYVWRAIGTRDGNEAAATFP